MRNKRLIGEILVLVVALALFGVGLFLVLRKNSDIQTGNELNVDWYDVNGKEFTLTTVKQLYEFEALSDFYDFKGQTIKLGADLVVNEGNAEDWKETPPARRWEPISRFAGTFDGQGHTISGIYATGFDTQLAFFSNAKSNCVIEDFKLVNSYIRSTGYGGTAAILSGGGGTVRKVYTDAILECNGEFCGGIASKMALKATLSECWFDGEILITGRTGGGILDAVQATVVDMEHCLFSGKLESVYVYSGARVGGLCAMVNKEGASLILKDSLSVGRIKTANAYYVGTALGVVYANTALEAEDTYGSSETYDVVIGRSGEAGTFRGTALDIIESDLIGDKAYIWTSLNFDKYWTTVEDSTPILQCFADKIRGTAGLEKAYDTSWYSPEKSEFVITNLKELYGLRMISARTDFAGKTVRLGADIAVNPGDAGDWTVPEKAPENPWYSIQKFNGTFDGQGHTVSGIYVRSTAQQLGFFRETGMSSVVKNFNLKNSYLEFTATGNALMGSIAGRGNGTYDTVYSNATLVSSGSCNGGIIGQINNDQLKNTVTNCWFDGKIFLRNGGRYGAGIVANTVKGATDITHCLNTGTISSDFSTGGVFAAGILSVTMNEGTVVNLDDCFNAGQIDVVYHVCVGSVVGRIQSGTRVAISNTYATTESYQNPTNGFMGVGSQSITTYKGGVADYYRKDIVGYGSYQRTTLDFSNYWAVDRKSTPILRSFADSVPSLSGVRKLVDISWYDENAKTFTLDSPEDLYGFYIVSALSTLEGKTVRLGRDITLNEGNAADWANSAPSGNWYALKKFSGTFDGQGHAIRGLYMNVGYAYAGLFSRVTESGVIRNLRLENSYFSNTIDNEVVAMGSIAGEFGGTMDGVYSNAIVQAKGSQFGGLIGRVNSLENRFKAKYRITNCWFDGSVRGDSQLAAMSYIGGLAGALIQGTLNMDNCLNTGTVTYMYNELPLQANGKVNGIGVHTGGLVGGVMNGRKTDDKGEVTMISEWNVTSCLGAGKIVSGMNDGSQQANGAGSILGYTTRGTVHVKDVYATDESSELVHGRKMHVNATQSDVTGSVVSYAQETLHGLGGYKYTLLDFQNYWAARAGAVPALKRFAGNGLSLANAWRLDTSWYDKSKDSFTISNVGQLYGFANLVNSGETFAGKTVSLGADIDVNVGWTAGPQEPENVWVPIGGKPTAGNAFKGTFDGQGHTIRGIYINETSGTSLAAVSAAAGLFGYTVDSTIRNLRLENSYMSSSTGVLGSIIGYGEGDLINIYSNADLVFRGSQVGGLIGRVQDGTSSGGNQKQEANCNITGCWFDGTIKSEDTETLRAGGLLGYSIYGDNTISHSLFTGKIQVAGGYVGGMIADSNGKNNTTIVITDSLSAGLVEGTGTNVGAVVGRSNGGATTVNRTVCKTDQCNKKAVGMVTGSGNAGESISRDETLLYGTDGYVYTELDFEQYWAAREGAVPTLKYFYGEGLDVSGLERKEPEDIVFISTKEELLDLARQVNEGENFAGKTIRLKNDIDLNEGWTAGKDAPDTVWTPIGESKSNAFSGTFDGQGHTISGIYLDESQTSSNSGLFGATIDCTIQNLKIGNSYYLTNKNTGNFGSIVGMGDGTFRNIYVDAEIVLDGGVQQQAGGIIGSMRDAKDTGKENSKCEISGCWFAGTITARNILVGSRIGGIAGYSVFGVHTISHCLFTGMIDAKTISYAGGIIADSNATNNTTIAITDSLSAGHVDGTGDGKGGVGAVVGRSNGGATTVDRTVCKTDQCNEKAVGNEDKVNAGESISRDEALLYGKGGYVYTELDFEQYWAARDKAVPAPKYFVGEGLDISELKSVIISDKEELLDLARRVKKGETFAGRTIRLDSDIDLNEGWTAGEDAPKDTAWTPIGTNSEPFLGTFDGQGHTIRGVYVNMSDKEFTGLFGRCGEGSIIRNLKLENSYFNSSVTDGNIKGVGSIVGYFQGARLENIYSDASVNAAGENAGGLIGGLYAGKGNEVTIANCWFAGNVTGANLFVGGLIGLHSTGKLTMVNCMNTGMVTNTYMNKDKLSWTGGLIGAGYDATDAANKNGGKSVSLCNCVNTGAVEVKGIGAVGSVIGRSRVPLTIENVYTTDNIQNTDGKKIETKNGLTGVGSATTNSNTVTGEPVKVDFSAEGTLAETLAALNAKAKEHESEGWSGWVEKDGIPALGKLVAEGGQDKTAQFRILKAFARILCKGL